MLNKDLAQFQTKYSVFYHKQAEVIAELYFHIICSKQLMRNLTFVIQLNSKPLSEKKAETNDALNKLSIFYFRHKIYFNTELCDKIENVIDIMNDSFIEFNIYQDEDDYKVAEDGGWKRSWKKIEKEVIPLTKELENEFRNLLQP